jgi:hypothetical protein
MFEVGADAWFIGYYADPHDNWYVLGEPLMDMRKGEVWSTRLNCQATFSAEKLRENAARRLAYVELT